MKSNRFDDLAKGFDKTKLNKRMDHMATEMFPDKKNPTFYMPNTGIIAPSKVDIQEKLNQGQWEEMEKNIKEYNNSLTKLDEDYANQEPLHGYIVRCFHLEVEKKNGIYLPFTCPVRVSTQNGLGTLETRESKWAYSTKAVVVSTPGIYSDSLIASGDIVQLDTAVTLSEQRTKEDPMVLPYFYALPEYTHISPPVDLKDKHYGYLLVPVNSIISKVKKK